MSPEEAPVRGTEAWKQTLSPEDRQRYERYISLCAQIARGWIAAAAERAAETLEEAS